MQALPCCRAWTMTAPPDQTVVCCHVGVLPAWAAICKSHQVATGSPLHLLPPSFREQFICRYNAIQVGEAAELILLSSSETFDHFKVGTILWQRLPGWLPKLKLST